MLSNKVVPIHYGHFRDAVLAGEIPVNYEVSLEMNRIDYLIDSPEYYYDDKAIEGFIEFCENELTLPDGSDLILTPTFMLWAESLLSWYYFIDEKIYNPNKKKYEVVSIKKRLVNKQYLIVSRSAAKSMYAAMIHAYFLVVDKTTTHQVITAPTIPQTEETISPIRTAIARSRGPLLSFLTEGNVRSNTITKKRLASTKKGIENFLTNSLLEARPMAIDKLQGLRTKVCTVDEWLSGKVKEDVIGALEQGASKIDDYVIIATSSEGTVRGGIGDSIKLELLSILRGEIFNPHVSIWHYKLDDVNEINNPEMWMKANPNIGITVSYDVIQKDVDRAENVPSARNDILAKRFGIPLEGYTYYFRYEETLPHPPVNFDGMVCSVGADLSQGDDFCAFTFLFPLGDGRFGIKTRSYVCARKVEKLPKAIANLYDNFIAENSLIVMDSFYLDMLEVYDDLDNFIIEHNYGAIALGFDPYNAKDFVNKWASENGDFGITKVIQGARTESVPLGELKNLAFDRMLIFDEQLMKFSMENTIAIEDSNGNRKLSKKRSEEKIDNVAALLDAWVAYKRNQEAFI